MPMSPIERELYIQELQSMAAKTAAANQAAINDSLAVQRRIDNSLSSAPRGNADAARLEYLLRYGNPSGLENTVVKFSPVPPTSAANLSALDLAQLSEYAKSHPSQGASAASATQGLLNSPNAQLLESQTRGARSDVAAANASLNARPVTASASSSQTGSNLAPPPASSFGNQLASGLAAVAITTGGSLVGGGVGGFVNDRLYGDNTNDETFAKIGANLGGLVGGAAGASLAGTPSLGIGALAGMAIGAAFGSFVGSLAGGVLDNLFGKKSSASVLGANYTNPANIPQAPFVGGQAAGVEYMIQVEVAFSGSPNLYHLVTSGIGLFENLLPDEYMLSAGLPIVGPIAGVGLNRFQFNGAYITVNGRDTPSFVAAQNFGTSQPVSVSIAKILRRDGQPDLSQNNAPNANKPFVSSDRPKIPSGALYDPSSPFDALNQGENYEDGTGKRKQPDYVPDALKPIPTPANPYPQRKVAPSTPSNPVGALPRPATNPSPSQTTAGANNISIPSFQAKPFISGKSKPSEQYDPVDINTGLTRSEFQKMLEKTSGANAVTAANFDAKENEKIFSQLSKIPLESLGGKSPQEVARENYLKSIAGDQTRLDAYNRTSSPTPLIPPPQKTTQNPTAPQPTPTPDNNGLAVIAAVSGTLLALKVGSDLLVNNSLINTPKIDQIAQNTTNQNQQTNAANGACTALNSAACTTGLKDSIVEPINANANANQAANDGKLAALLALLEAIQTALQGFITAMTSNIGKIMELLNRQVVDRVLAVTTFAMTLHNALMLSQGIGDTVGAIVDNILNLTNLSFKNSEGNTVGASEVIGANFRNFMVNLVGVENYTTLSQTFAQANRIYQAGMNIVNNVQSMLDSAASVAQSSGINIAKIGNALRDNHVVSPREYEHMDDTPEGNRAVKKNRFEQLTTLISDADSSLQNLSNITGNVVSIKDSVKQSKEDIKAFNDARDANSAANKQAKEDIITQIKELKPLTEISIAKRDDET